MLTLLHNAFVCTGLPGGFYPDGAILIRGSKIVWIGNRADMPPQPEPITYEDLGGRVVIPGLINTHAHGGLSTHRCSCDDGDLFQWAAGLAPHTSHLTVEDNRRGCYLAIMDMVRNGITTACDCTRYGAGVFADVATEIGMRSLSGALANSPELRKTGRPNWPLALDETTEAMELHKGNGLARFYLGGHSPYSCTGDLLKEVRREADRLDLPFVIHLAENRRENQQTLEQYGATPTGWLEQLGILDERSVLAHCVWMDEADMDILARRGSGVAHNPASNAKLASGVAPVPAMRKRGIPVGLGTDSTLSNNCLDLFQEMKLSVLLQRVTSLDGFIMNAEDAFTMATIEGAHVLSWDSEIGSLEAGKEADLVILNLSHPLGLTAERVLSDVVYHAGPQHVQAVMVAGRMIFRDGQLLLVDEPAIRTAIHEYYATH
ncbi:5-methylthioadenosine/S-adenosylhomocysteine deaminase [Nitratireductor aestuarii]|uniref:5-methylthioadenosine/S-adenosylhomocysteine deaminase n=1 Tax=Nitratireductor aestuarii TaxID=1735103 RepID=A0A916RTD3_9HYPH|nr:amidohydrolase [Nitratireductor aestuarii]GGA68773.1 5-methylthioadenosine/S-adenosylhomocysteine deaminase [Nitratireductor aestuarii]